MGTIGENIRNARMKSGLTQTDLAEIINVTKTSISKYELGQREPKKAILQKIALALNTSLYELYDGQFPDDFWTAEDAGEILCDDEAELLATLKTMNPLGKRVAKERVQELAENPRYQKIKPSEEG